MMIMKMIIMMIIIIMIIIIMFCLHRDITKDHEKLKAAGVTHVVNCAQGKKMHQVDTNTDFYEPAGIRYHGFVATDILTFKMTPHLQPAADYIEEALISGGRSQHRYQSRLSFLTVVCRL